MDSVLDLWEVQLLSDTEYGEEDAKIFLSEEEATILIDEGSATLLWNRAMMESEG